MHTTCTPSVRSRVQRYLFLFWAIVFCSQVRRPSSVVLPYVYHHSGFASSPSQCHPIQVPSECHMSSLPQKRCQTTPCGPMKSSPVGLGVHASSILSHHLAIRATWKSKISHVKGEKCRFIIGFAWLRKVLQANLTHQRSDPIAVFPHTSTQRSNRSLPTHTSTQRSHRCVHKHTHQAIRSLLFLMSGN